MKFLDMIKLANKNKQHIHRVPSTTKRGRQIASQASPVCNSNNTVSTGLRENEQSSIKGRTERTHRTRDI
jgi:DNA-directed RNA polymerase subunit K/omega